MKEQSFLEGEKIIKYGDQGKEYFVLLKGKVKVIIFQKGSDPNDDQLN